MVALILAGGFGTRISTLFSDLPKPLIGVGGFPFLEYQLKILSFFDIKKVIISTGYLGEKIKNYFGKGSNLGLEIIYSHEAEPLGTGGAIKLASALVKENFLLWNGDDMPIIDWVRFLKFINKNPEKNIMTIHGGGNGNIEINEKSRKVVSYLLRGGEKGYEWSHAGLAYLNRDILKILPEEKFDFEETFFRQLTKKGELLYFKADDITLSIGTPKRLERTKELLPTYFERVTNAKI